MNTYSTVFGNDTIPPTQSSYSALTLIENTILFWPELAQGVTLASDIMDLSAASPYALALPEADKVSNGRSLLLNNIGSADITITDSGGAILAIISAGVVKNVYLTDNSTVSGVWRVYTFGTGTSTADASSLAGYGLTVIAGDLAQDSPTHTTAGNATLAVTDRASTYIFKNTGMVTCGLLAANTAGSGYFVDLVNQGTGAVQINPDSSETIDGALTKDLAPGESARVTCDGTNWVTVGYGRSTQFQFTKLVLDITTGSPFTLTSTQAQNKLIQLIGSPTAPVTITVPAVVAIYYIECSYSGAFHVTFGSGGTTIDLIGTDRVIAYCDGINVVFAQTTAIPATNIAGGVAGAVVVQTGIGATGFTAAGVLGQLFASNGTGIPQWVAATFSGSTLTVPQYYNVTAVYGALQVGGSDAVKFDLGGMVPLSNQVPLFMAQQSISQAIAAGAGKILFQVEEYDTAGCFASSTFTPTVAGWYQVNWQVFVLAAATTIQTFLYKNGSGYKAGGYLSPLNNPACGGSTLVYLNGLDDNISVYASSSVSGTTNPGSLTYFNGCLVRRG